MIHHPSLDATHLECTATGTSGRWALPGVHRLLLVDAPVDRLLRLALVSRAALAVGAFVGPLLAIFQARFQIFRSIGLTESSRICPRSDRKRSWPKPSWHICHWTDGKRRTR